MINLSSVFAEQGKEIAITGDVVLEKGLISADADVTVKTDVKIRNNAGVVCAEGFVEFEYALLCDRCASETVKHAKIKINHVLVDTLNNEKNDDFILIANKNWDFEETLTADIILSLPAKNLCKSDCKGLCQTCGHNLNEDDCDCKKTQIDPRLEKLKEFFN